MMSELEVTPNVPPDWRDWINEFPTVKSLAIFCFVAWIITPIEMSVLGWLIGNAFISGKDEIDAVLSLVDKWLDALNILTWAAVFGVVGKFIGTKSDVIRAEGEVKAKTIVAAAQAAAIVQPVGASSATAPVVPETVLAMQAAATARAADPAAPVGASVAGEGD